MLDCYLFTLIIVFYSYQYERAKHYHQYYENDELSLLLPLPHPNSRSSAFTSLGNILIGASLTLLVVIAFRAWKWYQWRRKLNLPEGYLLIGDGPLAYCPAQVSGLLCFVVVAGLV